MSLDSAIGLFSVLIQAISPSLEMWMQSSRSTMTPLLSDFSLYDFLLCPCFSNPPLPLSVFEGPLAETPDLPDPVGPNQASCAVKFSLLYSICLGDLPADEVVALSTFQSRSRISPRLKSAPIPVRMPSKCRRCCCGVNARSNPPLRRGN
jgi:hypothetical protein